MGVRRDYTGQVYGKLTAIEPLAAIGRDWRLGCECGAVVVNRPSAMQDRVNRGFTPSCDACKRGKKIAEGARFGLLTAIKQVGAGAPSAAKWEWRCACDGKAVVLGARDVQKRQDLGRVVSCGCYVNPCRPATDYSGRRFGRLEAVRHVGPGREWLFKCDCGDTTVRRPSRVIEYTDAGKTVDCGCGQSAALAAAAPLSEGVRLF